MARQVQDMSGGYLDITDADETAGREMQDMAGGYIDLATSAGSGIAPKATFHQQRNYGST